jgi:predicted ATPase/DNA-binding SARP family transcriptional activator
MTTHGEPRLELFGGAVLIADGSRRPLTGERRDQLLVLLALQGGEWTPRDRVACLLWPDRPPSDGRRNLRKVLFRAHELPGAEGLQASEDALRWAIGSDVADFRAALREGRTADAIAAPFAHLCDGFDAACGDEFARWLRGERDALAAQWHRACAERLAVLESPIERAALARRLLDVDPLDEGAVEALMRAELAQGRSVAARALFLDFAVRVAEALGVEPSNSLRSLVPPGVEPAAAAAAAADESEAETFVGRRGELAELAALLVAPEGRVVTVSGPGGIGKSRLVREALPGLATGFSDGSCWIELQDLLSLTEAAGRLAQSLGVEVLGVRDPLAPVLAWLKHRSVLLVFDNAEHLPELASAIDRISAASARSRVLVTSRSRIHASSEVLLPLAGLARPDEESRDVEAAATFDAVRLFERRARLARRGFELGDHLEAVLAIVDAVEGMPLAIELAASWVRLLPPAEIARDLAQSIDVLERDPAAPMPAQRPEHQSLRAVVQHSFGLLAPSEREALARLSVFKGGFTRSAAQAVAAASLPVLSSLVDKSLVASDGQGRFDLHPVIASFATEQLASQAAEAASTQLRHAIFFARDLDALAPHARGDIRLLAAGVSRELANVRSAWHYALSAQRTDLVDQMVRALWRFYEHTGRQTEGISLLSPALALSERDATAVRALARLRLGLSMLHTRMGNPSEAVALGEAAIAAGEDCGDLEAHVGSMLQVGAALWHQGRHAEARERFERGLAIARRHQDSHCIALALGNLAISQTALGQPREAIATITEALARDRAVGNVNNIAGNLHNLGVAHRDLRDWAAARDCFEQGLDHARRYGLRVAALYMLFGLGNAKLRLRLRAEARRHLDEAVVGARALTLHHLELLCERELARADLAEGQHGEAIARVRRIARMARDTGQPIHLRNAAIVFGEWLAAQGCAGDALRVWQTVEGDERMDAKMRADLMEARSALKSDPPQGDTAGTAALTLEEVLAQIERSPGIVAS